MSKPLAPNAVLTVLLVFPATLALVIRTSLMVSPLTRPVVLNTALVLLKAPPAVVSVVVPL